MHASRNPACVRMHLRAYIHFERARSARLVVAATRMLDARPPAESMEHPFTTHSPSVSACLCGLPIGIPLAFLSLFLSSQHAFRFLYHPFPLSSSVSLYFHLFSVNLSPSFISIFFSVCRLHLRPYLETFALDFSLFKESQSLSLSSFLLLADFIHLSSPVLSLRDSCALSNRAFLRVIFEATYRSLSVAAVSLVSLLCERQEETEREEGKENLLHLLVSPFISIAIPPATDAQLYAISLCSFSIRST